MGTVSMKDSIAELCHDKPVLSFQALSKTIIADVRTHTHTLSKV